VSQLTLLERHDRRFGWFLTAPGLFLLILVIMFPIFWALLISGFDYTLIDPGFHTFVGIDNFTMVLQDEEFRSALLTSMGFVIAVVVLEFLLGFLIALMLNSVERGKNIYYMILLCPLLMNPVIVGLIWRMLLHPTLGIVNYVLSIIYLDPVNWLGETTTAFWTVVGVDIWHQVSFMVIMLLAGLSALPIEPYEAARVDGASTWQCFWKITLPMMRPVIMVTLLIRMIFAIKTYDLIYIMTRGGPGSATDLISYYIYRTAFVGLNLGESSAMSAILLVLIILMTTYLHRYMRKIQ
jgi:multiple sugar transport system permease protein